MPTATKSAPEATSPALKRGLFGLDEDIRAQLVESLNPLQADALAMYVKVKKAHWTVMGPHFRDLHLMLDDHATFVLGTIDAIAERVLMIGGVPLGNLAEIRYATQLTDFPSGRQTTSILLDTLFDDTNAQMQRIRDAIELAASVGDPGTADMLTQHVQMYEKFAWFVSEILEADALAK